MLSEVIVTFPPTALNVHDFGALVVPSGTFPKLRLIGVMLRPAPVPEILAVASVVVPFLNDTAPEALPVDVGVKVIEKATVFPDPTVTGKAIPVTPNPAPVIVLLVMLTSPPAAVRLAGICAVVPTRTFPKLKLAGLIESWPAAVVKFTPATFALLTVTAMLGGTKL